MQDNKYKERLPEETVEVIKNFFASLGSDFRLELRAEKDTKVGFFWHRLFLYYKDMLVIDTTGKGATRNLSMASAYAEMYERFCCLYLSGIEAKDHIPFGADEREITNEEAMLPFLKIKEAEKDNVAEYMRLLYGGLWGVPFKNICGGEDMDMDLNCLGTIFGSNGMAAGNTLKEALNQGISEVFERYIHFVAYYGGKKFKLISEEVINGETPEIYEKIKLLEQYDISVRVYDASFDTGLPVLCALLLDKNRMQHCFSFGAFPVFEIALERTLSEALQGKMFIEDLQMTPCTPFEGASDNYNIMGGYGGVILPETVFVEAETVHEVNKAVYLPKDTDNDRIFEHIQSILSEKSLDGYYRDMSLSEDIKAVWVCIPELEKGFDISYVGGKTDNLLKVDELLTDIRAHRLNKDNLHSKVDLMESFCSQQHSYLKLQLLYTGMQSSIVEYMEGVIILAEGDWKNIALFILGIDEHYLKEKKMLSELQVLVNFYTFLNKTTQKEVKKRISLWGLAEDYDKLSAPYHILEKYLYGALYGERAVARKQHQREIRGKISNMRCANESN